MDPEPPLLIKKPIPSPPSCSYDQAMASRVLSRTPTPGANNVSLDFNLATPTPARISHAFVNTQDGTTCRSPIPSPLSLGPAVETPGNKNNLPPGGGAIDAETVPVLLHGTRDEEDREGVHNHGQQPYGLGYSQQCLASLPVLIDAKNPETHTIVRGINAHQVMSSSHLSILRL